MKKNVPGNYLIFHVYNYGRTLRSGICSDFGWEQGRGMLATVSLLDVRTFDLLLDNLNP